MNQWFGTSWGAPCCYGDPAPTPVGQPCAHCGELIEAGDSGMLIPHIEEADDLTIPTIRPSHRECFLRSITGSLGCLAGLCGNPECFAVLEPRVRVSVPGFQMTDPPGLTKRECAQAAEQFFNVPPSPGLRLLVLTRWLTLSASRVSA